MIVPRLYRGETQLIPPGGRQAFIREDRRPRDTGDNLAFNICFNLMIERHLGVPLVRRRSLFVCGDISQVLRYAAVPDAHHIGIVEPVGSYRFLYACNVVDSAHIARDLADRYLACFHAWQRPRCAPLLEDMTLTLPKLNTFLAEHPDVDSGGFAWGKSRLQDRIFAMLDGLARSTFKRTYPYTDKDLPAAIAAGVEVMIFDCPQGYRITPIDASELPRPASPGADSGRAHIQAEMDL